MVEQKEISVHAIMSGGGKGKISVKLRGDVMRALKLLRFQCQMREKMAQNCENWRKRYCPISIN